MNLRSYLAVSRWAAGTEGMSDTSRGNSPRVVVLAGGGVILSGYGMEGGCYARGTWRLGAK
jgi:hypothetical protein